MSTNAAANENAIPTAESKHKPGRDLKEIAKDVRADVALACKAGLLPRGLKASVRISRYSMGQSLTVSVVACPGVLVSTKRIREEIAAPHDFTRTPYLSAEALRIRSIIEAIVNAYNRNRSDIMNDHFDVISTGRSTSRATSRMPRRRRSRRLCAERLRRRCSTFARSGSAWRKLPR